MSKDTASSALFTLGRTIVLSAVYSRYLKKHVYYSALLTKTPRGFRGIFIWSGKRDSNSRPRPWQGRALPTELFPRKTFIAFRLLPCEEAHILTNQIKESSTFKHLILITFRLRIMLPMKRLNIEPLTTKLRLLR